MLQENGVRYKMLDKGWSCSCKPVPDMMTGGTGADVAYRLRRAPFLSFAEGANRDPLHYGVALWIDRDGGDPTPYDVFCKVNFSLRDPK